MWAQLIKLRLKPGREADVERLHALLESLEQSDSGLVRSTAFRDQGDSLSVYFLVEFESEEKARARESDPRRADGLEVVRSEMETMVDGPREFVDLEVIATYGD